MGWDTHCVGRICSIKLYYDTPTEQPRQFNIIMSITTIRLYYIQFVFWPFTWLLSWVALSIGCPIRANRWNVLTMATEQATDKLVRLNWLTGIHGELWVGTNGVNIIVMILYLFQTVSEVGRRFRSSFEQGRPRSSVMGVGQNG